MLVTKEGVVRLFNEQDLLDWLFNGIEDTVDDDVAEYALDVACFLQDEDVQTPMDALVSYPISMTTTDLDLE